jgi:hypothetical protein
MSAIPNPDDGHAPGLTVEAGRDTTTGKNVLADGFDKIPWNAFSLVGLSVFLLSGMSIVYVIVLFVPEVDIPNFEVLRSVELLLRLGATAVVVAIIASFRNTFVVIFGIFLIAALIVPRGDLIRFALLASGSPNRFRDFFVETTPMKNPDARDREIASNIMDNLINNARAIPQGVALSNGSSMVDYLTDGRRQFSEAIARIVFEERERTLFAELVQ